MNPKTIGILAVFAVAAGPLPADEPDQPLVTMDEDRWVAFYDVPSRRFRDIRNAFMQRNFTMAARDLGASASYLRIEADRALPELAVRLNDVASRMIRMSENLEDTAVSVTDLDASFGRAHWLLAQHYLDMARRARDRQRWRVEGRYLFAATHHLERAVLWSDARVDKKLYRALEDLRDLAARLQDDKQALKAHREKPLVQADKTVRQLGELIDRPVVIPTQQ